MVQDGDAKQPAVLGRARPSDGKAKRLLRSFQSRFAMSVVDVMRVLRVSERQAWRYISRLHNEKRIYQRYRQDKYVYYSLRRKL